MTDSETNENEVTGTEVEAPETGAAVEPSDEEQVLTFLKEHGSEVIQERMKDKEGEKFCVSYVLKNVQEEGCKVGVAVGWLEQALSGT